MRHSTLAPLPLSSSRLTLTDVIKISCGRRVAYLAFSHFSGLKQITKRSDEHQGWWPNPSGRNAARREEKQGVLLSAA